MRKLKNYENNCLPYYSSLDSSPHLLNSRNICGLPTASEHFNLKLGNGVKIQQVSGWVDLSLFHFHILPTMGKGVFSLF